MGMTRAKRLRAKGASGAEVTGRKARQRTTRDEWRLWVNYGQGWEHECSEDSWRAAREQAKTYRANVAYPVKLTGPHRVRLEADPC
jgi:hypothetical protein